MVRFVVHPFCSQQDKSAGKFRLDTCGTCRMLAWLVDRVQSELGWECTAVLPLQKQCHPLAHPFACDVERRWTPIENPLQRVHWNISELSRLYEGADVALLNHELLSVPVRALYPRLRIVQQCVVEPEPLGLFQSAWAAADLVTVHGELNASRIRRLTSAPVVSWPMGYNADNYSPSWPGRPVDVFFAARASASNYTHHLEFLEAMKFFPAQWRVVFSDVTGYLKKLRPDLEYSTPSDAEFRAMLHSSKVAVLLHTCLSNFALHEAVAAGCVPVALENSASREVLGENWLGYCTPDPDSVFRAVWRAMTATPADCAGPRARVKAESCQAAWPRVKQDLTRLVG